MFRFIKSHLDFTIFDSETKVAKHMILSNSVSYIKSTFA